VRINKTRSQILTAPLTVQRTAINTKAHEMIVPAAAIAAALMLFPIAAHGADLEAADTEFAPPQEIDTRRYGDFRDTLADWHVTIGAGAIYMPEYEGSDKFDVKPFPMFSARFGERVLVETTGVTIDLIKWEGFKIAARGGYELGRKEDDSDYLRGLGDIDAGGVVGGIVSYEAGPFEVYASLNKTIGGSDGLLGTFGARASHRYDSFIFTADVSGTWADDKYMEAYFGVTSAQSLSSGLAQYDAGAGVKRVDAKLAVTYMLTDNWLVTGAVGAGLLMGDAKDSPIVKDDVQPFGMIGIAYKF
jgi:outer membrane scaffolding protein for murein synthesis (MipA/OmpV family)